MEGIIIEPILFIAPSQPIANLASQINTQIGLPLQIIVGNSQQAMDIVKSHQECSMIISRGASAEAIKHLPGKTVVEIVAAPTDVMAAIGKAAERGWKKLGIVARTNILDDESQQFQFSGMEVFLRTCLTDTEVKAAIQTLSSDGVEGIVGDNAVIKIAESCGLPGEFLDSGRAAVKKAIVEAERIARSQDQERKREQQRKQQISSYASEMQTALEHSVAAIQQLSASSEQLAATSRNTAEIARTAAGEVNNTSRILDVIRHVAKQSNLLGLNAAIEAARAGENGRGFSVVANEVRKLADESTRSAGNIDQMLQSFRSSVNCVVDNVNQSMGITEDQAKAIQEIATKLEGLRNVGSDLLGLASVKSTV